MMPSSSPEDPTEGYPRDGEFVGRVSSRLGTQGAMNTMFRQVRGTESVIPYVLCVVCIALGVDRGDLG
jgi:hypothetical protein